MKTVTAATMPHRVLGRTGLAVSELGLGTWAMGFMWGPLDDDEARRALRRALASGINFFDTALVYGDGHSEQLIGEVLRDTRSAAVVASKIPPKTMEWPARHGGLVRKVFPPGWVLECTERTLRHLGCDTLDLQQLHVWSDTWLADLEWQETFAAVERLKRQGKIRWFGISINDHDADSALEAVASGVVDTVQVIYNLFEQRPAERLLPLCQQHRVGVIVRVPLDEGSLTGTFSRKTTFRTDDWRARYFKGTRLADTVTRVERLVPLAQRERLTLPQLALAFCLAHPAVSTVIPGMRKVKHVEDNVAAAGRRLSAATLEALRDHAWPRNFYQP